MIHPGQTIGVLGGGPLGRMFAQAAQTLGYRVHVFAPQAGGPADAVANEETNASYDNLAALRAFACDCAVVTCEFENIPVESLRALAAATRLHPSPDVLHICQNRQREKHWLGQNKFSHAVCAEALDGDVAAAVARVGRPCVVKTADFDHDGRGQMKITDDTDLEQAGAISADGAAWSSAGWISHANCPSSSRARSAARSACFPFRKTFTPVTFWIFPSCPRA